MSEVQLEKGELSVKAVIGIVSFCALLIVGFYTQVVIPIRDIQVGLAEVQATLATHNVEEKRISEILTAMDKRITALENKK